MHYILYVIGDVDLAEAMAPFQEADGSHGCDTKYMTTDDCTEDYAEYGDDLRDSLEMDGFDLLSPGEDPVCGEAYAVLTEDNTLTGAFRWTNKQGYWDFYHVGGRWAGRLLLLDGTYSNSAKVGDIDWEGMRTIAAEEAEREWATWEAYKAKYSIKAKFPYLRDAHKYPPKEETLAEYVKDQVMHAGMCQDILHNGEWRSPTYPYNYDEWFPSVRAQIEALDPNTLLTVVDYHA